jgi:hypothetical protein
LLSAWAARIYQSPLHINKIYQENESRRDGTIPAALSPLPAAVFMQPLGAGKDQRELGLVDVGNSPKDFKSRVLGTVLDPKHIGIVASHAFGDVLVGPATLYAQIRNHSAQRSLGRVAPAFQRFDWTAHGTSSAIDSCYFAGL